MNRAAFSVVFGLGCGAGAPSDAPSYVERWELLGVMGDGSVVDARVTIGNTGLLRGQGRVEVDHWPRAGEPIRYARWSAPEATVRSADGRVLSLDTDQLRGVVDATETWHLRARSDEANAVLNVQGRGQAIPEVSAPARGGMWTVGAPVGAGRLQGWFEAGERGGKADGWGVVLHRGGDGRPGPDRRALFVMSDDLSLGLDEQGPVTLAWGHLGGRALDMSSARITYDAGAVGLDLRPAEDLSVRFELTSAHGQTDRIAHWTLPERWLMGALGGREARTVVGARVKVVVGDVDEQPRRGLVVWTDPAPLDLPRVAVERPQRRRKNP